MIPRLPNGFTHPMRIGEGGFASVYRTRQTTLDRWVAIKILHEKDRLKKKDLLREGKTQARLMVECVPQIYDAFEWKNRIFIVMQWVKGVSLSRLLSQSMQAPHRHRVAAGLISSLANLHRLGYAHRDLKPANIQVSSESGIHFVDFGFSKSISDGNVSLIGVVKGTPAYMAPELWLGGSDVDYLRADIYALGRILRELYAGEELPDLVLRCSSEKPADRPANGIELLGEWSALFKGSAESPSWADIVADLSSEQLSKQLTSAAMELRYAGRNEEAYWLLVESLEENSNNAEAIALMESFGKKRNLHGVRKQVPWLIAAGFAMGLAALGFFLGRTSSPTLPPVPTWNATTPEQRLTLRESGAAAASTIRLPLLADTTTAQGLNARIQVAGHPQEGALKIDGVSYTALPETGIELSFGSHILEWTNATGRTVWRSRVNLLPFQIKVVTVQARS